MYEGVVFQLLHSLQLAVLAKGLFKYLLCNSARQVSHKQHLDLGREACFVYSPCRNAVQIQTNAQVERGCACKYTQGYIAEDFSSCALPWPWPLGLGPQWDQPTPLWPNFPKLWPCHSLVGAGPELPSCDLHTQGSKNLDSFSCHLAGGTIWHHLDPL